MQRLINSNEFKNESRRSKNSFIRERKLPFKELLKFLLRGVARTTCQRGDKCRHRKRGDDAMRFHPIQEKHDFSP